GQISCPLVESCPFRRPALQYCEAADGATCRHYNEFSAARRVSRWMAQPGHRLHGGSLCFRKRVPYTALMELAVAVMFGLIIGSFLNVVILRLPQGISIS